MPGALLSDSARPVQPQALRVGHFGGHQDRPHAFRRGSRVFSISRDASFTLFIAADFGFSTLIRSQESPTRQRLARRFETGPSAALNQLGADPFLGIETCAIDIRKTGGPERQRPARSFLQRPSPQAGGRAFPTENARDGLGSDRPRSCRPKSDRSSAHSARSCSRLHRRVFYVPLPRAWHSGREGWRGRQKRAADAEQTRQPRSCSRQVKTRSRKGLVRMVLANPAFVFTNQAGHALLPTVGATKARLSRAKALACSSASSRLRCWVMARRPGDRPNRCSVCHPARRPQGCRYPGCPRGCGE